jgi:hypothetical protein
VNDKNLTEYDKKPTKNRQKTDKKMTKKMTVWIMSDKVSDLFLETLEMDSESIYFDMSLRKEIERGLDKTTMIDKKVYDAKVLKGEE